MSECKHELKTWPYYFRHILSGKKNFEIRNNDRGFRVGDTLVLKEFSPTTQQYTGREVIKKVNYILGSPYEPTPFLPAGVVVMGLEDDRLSNLEAALKSIYDATAADKGLTMHETTKIYCTARDALAEAREGKC